MSRPGIILLIIIAFAASLGSLMIAWNTVVNRPERERFHTSREDSLIASVAALHQQIDSLTARMPGLGEYMTSLQLHMAKVWFAERAQNWPLADYEIGEAREAIDGAKALHAKKNNIDITLVLQSISDTLIAPMQQSIARHDASQFVSSYSGTIITCNACHAAAGYSFIHIIIPTAPPVANQTWRQNVSRLEAPM